MNRHGGVSSRGSRWDTGTKTNEYSWTSVPVTDEKKHAHQWQLMGARAKIVWKTKAVRHLTSYTAAPDPMEQVIKHHHHRNEHDPPYRRPMMLLGMSTHIHHIRGVSSSPASLFIFHFCDMLTRALYNKCRYRYRYLPVEKNPHLFLLHHSCIGLTLSQYVETNFWSVEIFQTP